MPSVLSRLACSGLLLIAPACTGYQRSAASDADVPRRKIDLATTLTQRATDMSAKDPSLAEQLLREAVDADPYNGTARNNLGVLLLNAGRLHEAALSFEAARKLMPSSPDPRLNLGLTFERAGRFEDAMMAYQDALDVCSDFVPAMQALAMCEIRHAKRNKRTAELLHQVSMRGETAQWRAWAAEESLKSQGPQAFE